MSYAQNFHGAWVANERETEGQVWWQSRGGLRRSGWAMASALEVYPDPFSTSLPRIIRGLIAQESIQPQFPIHDGSDTELTQEKPVGGIIFKSKGVVQRAANLLRRPPHARRGQL